MMEKELVNHNGKIVHRNQVCLPLNNRSFLYGDGLFETIRIIHSKPVFLEDHLQRLSAALKFLKIDARQVSFADEISKFLEKLPDLDSGRLRLTVFRKEGGYYDPQSNEVSFLITAKKLEDENYQLSRTGLKVEIYKEMKKPLNALAGMKTANALFYVLAGVEKQKQKMDELLLLNEEGKIAEAISSNLFLVQDQHIYTPSLEEGCLAGVMRKNIIRLAGDLGYYVDETIIDEEDLFAADEIFLTNAIKGIQWVAAFRNKRYFHKVSENLVGALGREVLRLVK